MTKNTSPLLSHSEIRQSLLLYSSFLARAAAVVRQGRDVFDRLNLQASGFQRGDRTFAAAAGAFYFYVDVLHAKLARLFSHLLGSTLAGKRSALAASFEPARAGAGPTERVALGIGDRDHRVVEGRHDVGDCHGHVATRGLLLDLRFFCALDAFTCFTCFGCFGHLVLNSKQIDREIAKNFELIVL